MAGRNELSVLHEKWGINHQTQSTQLPTNEQVQNFLSKSLLQEKSKSLLLILIVVLANDVVEAKLVDTLGGGDDTEPVTELLLLEELLCQVLEVATGELLVGDDLDLAVVEVGDGDAVAEVAGQAVDLDAGLQEGGEGGGVEDLVVGGLRSVDGVLFAVCQQSPSYRKKESPSFLPSW